MRLCQVAIAMDQLVNTLFGGFADETISARCYRRAPVDLHWRIAERVIDALFFWEDRHCYRSYISEIERRHFPSEYRK